MPNYKFFYLGFLYTLIFNLCEPCFSLPYDSCHLKISEAHCSIPLEIMHPSSPFNRNKHNQKNPTLNDVSPSHRHSYNPLERAIYAKMSPQQFRENFEHELNEEHILKNYELFAYEGFRVFAQSLPSYQKFICSLDEKIKNDKAVSARTACVEGFYYSSFLWWETSEFHKFVHEEAEKIRKNNPGYFDYSSQVPPPIQGDRYADVFKNTYGTMQDYELHKELHQTRTTIIELERKFPHCDHVQFVAPVVHHIAARAKAESNSTKARDLSKFCQTITSVVSKCAHTLDVFSRSTKSIGKGVIKGVKKVLTVEHWKEMATGALHLGLLLVKAVNQHDENDRAANAALLSDNGDTPFKFEQEYALKVKTYVRAINQSIQKTYQKMKTMTWEQLLENGVEIGTTLVLDVVTLNALNGLAYRTSRMVVEEIGRALEQSACYATEECMVEVVGFGKLIIEEGIERVPYISATIKNESVCLNAFSHETVSHKIKKQIDKVFYCKSEGDCIVSENFVNLATKERTQHILYGDKTGGGHLWPGKADKSIFPSCWNADKVMHYVSDLATDSSLKPIWTRGAEGSLLTKSGLPSRYYIEGIREGIKIRVVIEPVNGKIITAFPIY